MRVTVLVNPAAGRGRAVALAEAAVDRLRELGAEVSVRSGRSVRETERLAAEALAERPDRLAVVGGDGTLSAILEPLMRSEVPLVLIPAGTGNDLARALCLPQGGARAAVAAAELALTGSETAIDAAVAECPDGRAHFVTVAALGFDARVSERTNRLRWPHGRLRYFLALAIELVRLSPLPFRISADGGAPYRAPGILVAVANTPSYGGGMPMCPRADIRDGLLDVTRIGPISRLTLVRLFPLLLRARHLERAEVGSERVRHLRIDAPGLVVYADGERVGTGPVEISVRPGALRVMAPRDAA